MAFNYRCYINIPLTDLAKDLFLPKGVVSKEHVKKKRGPTLKNFKKYEYAENFREMAN